MASLFDGIRSAAARRACCPICLDDLVSRPDEVGALTSGGRRVEQALYHRSCVGVAARGGIPRLPNGRSPITRLQVDGFRLMPPLRDRRGWRCFVDWNGDGRITVSELSAAIAAMLPVDEAGVERVLQETLRPADGEAFTEAELEDRVLPHLEAHAAELAVSAPCAGGAPGLSRASSRAELLAWFRHWDADGSGSLDAEELSYAVAAVFFRALGEADNATKQAVVEAFLHEARLAGSGPVTKSRFLESLAPALQVNLPGEAAEPAGAPGRPAAGPELRLTMLLSTTGASASATLPASGTLGDVRRAALERLDHGAGPGAVVELFRGGRRVEGADEAPLSACQLQDGAVLQVLVRPAQEEADRLRRMREELAAEREALRREREELETARRRRHDAAGTGPGAGAGPSAAPAGPRRYAPGTRVTILGLRATPELNGRAARVVRFDEASGRYVVEVEGADGGQKSLRPESLNPCEGEAGQTLLDGLEQAAKRTALRLQLWAARYETWQLLLGACVVLLFVGAYFQVGARYRGGGSARYGGDGGGRSGGSGRSAGYEGADQRGDRGRRASDERWERLHEQGYDDDYGHGGHGGRSEGLLDGLDQNTLLLLAAGFGYLCYQGHIPVQNLDFWQGMMLWNIIQPILFGGRRGGGRGMGSFGGGYGGMGGMMGGMGMGGMGFGRRGFF